MKKEIETNKFEKILFKKVQSEHDSRYNNLSGNEIINVIKEKSVNNKYSAWVIREYLKNNIQRFEDMDRVQQALILFKNNLQKFDNSQKQLNKMSFQELETLVSPYQDILTQNAVKRMNKEKIWAKTEFIYDGVEGKILVPLSEESAIFWGQGTRWCTASTSKYNAYDYYSKRGPLYVFIVNKKDENGREIKYQLHFETEQFVDSEDRYVNMIDDDLVELLLHLNEKSKLLLCLMCFDFFKKANPFPDLEDDIFSEHASKRAIGENEIKTFLQKKNNCHSQEATKLIDGILQNYSFSAATEDIYKAVENPTYDFTMFALSKNGSLIEYVNNQTEEMKWAALKQNPKSIRHIKEPSDEMKLEACKKDGFVVSFLDGLTEEMMFEACKSNSVAIKYIKNPTPEMYMNAIKSNKFCVNILETIPDEIKFEVLKYSGEAIKFIDNPTDDMMLEACKKGDWALEYIKNPTKEMIMESLKSHPYTLKLFDNPTEEMCLEAVKRNGNVLSAIVNPSDAVKLAAIENYGFAIEYIMEPTDEMKLEAVKQNGLAIEYINDPSDETKWTALKQNPLCFSHIVDPTEEMMLFSFEALVRNNKIFDIIHKINFSDTEKIEYCLQKSQDNKILKYYFEIMLKINKKVEFENKFDLL